MKNLQLQGFSIQHQTSMPSLNLPWAERDEENTTYKQVERRNSGLRARARDQLLARPSRVIANEHRTYSNEENLLLLMDDDVREAALALLRIEQFLLKIRTVIDQPNQNWEQISALSADSQINLEVEQVAETIENLCRRLNVLATNPR